MFVLLAVSLSLLTGTFGSCPGNTEVYTGDGRVQWKAEINGVDSPGVLAPNNQKFFFVADERMIDVMVKLVPNNLLLQEISIETHIVKKVSAHGQSREIDSESWETTRFTYDNLPINNVDVFVESEGSEMEIRNVFIRGCVPIDWCPWDSWSDCTVSCGVGQQTRTRECRCPNPDPALFQCEGPDTQTRTCQQPCCEEQIDFNNRKGVKVQVKGPGVVKGVDLLLGAPASQNVLVNNSDGINFIAVTFQGKRDILEVGLETQFSGKVKLKAKPGKWTATDSVPVDDNYYKSTFKAPGGQLNNQKSLTLKFNYPSGEIGVRRLYLIVCKK